LAYGKQSKYGGAGKNPATPRRQSMSENTLTLEFLNSKRQEILRLANKYGARNVRIFGSTARGAATPESDLDMLVEFEPERSLLDQTALMQELERLFGCQVHVVEPEGLHWYIRDAVLNEAVPL
jgi:hypothetical protein